jgi:hypothetical protein
MRAKIPSDVAALLEKLDRQIEESEALRAELREKKTANLWVTDETVHGVSTPLTSRKTQ